jgi:hypothetical protein
MESSFPPLYAAWLQSFLGAPPPEEKLATCGECPMREGRAAEVAFVSTKCCTFFPELPSFAVGRVLLDEHPDMQRGQERVRARIQLGQQITPLGIGRPGVLYAVYRNGLSFGVANALRCPYFLDEGPGLCTVWRHREGVCASWFCKHERGILGSNFWTAIRKLLKTAEEHLTFKVALELGIYKEALEAVKATSETLDRGRNPEYYAGIWGPWAGREIEYYSACADLVSKMTWDDVRARCGNAVDEFVAKAKELMEHMQRPPQMPDLVRIRPFHRVGKIEDRTVLRTYSTFDSLELPDRTAAALLVRQSGRLEDLVRDLADQGVDRKLLERMYEVGLLEDGAD